MPRYKLHDTDGGDLGDVRLAEMLRPGDVITLGVGRQLRVVEVVAVMELDSPYVALAMVEPLAKP